MSLLCTEGLSKHFAGLSAVAEVDFDLPEGQVRALIGPNGAGKTTLVGMICGRLRADAGRVVFDGRDVTGMAAHRRIRRGMAYTFQITSVFGRLPVHENVALAARRRLAGPQVDAAVREALDRVGLTEDPDRPAGDLSYGHQRLLELAMGLVQAPRLLILDEPTQGLSDSEIARFTGLVRALAGQVTVLLIEHNMHVVMQVADAVTVMNQGAILAEGTPAEIHDNPAVQAAYLGTN
jgi:branched-chain amino acid transport system ATP-binding protein